MKKLVVLGGGESGVGAAILGKDKGMDVFLSDMGALKDEYRETLVRENIEFEEGRHSEERILDADIVVKSPGIPPYAPMVRKITDKNIPVLSEIEFAEDSQTRRWSASPVQTERPPPRSSHTTYSRKPGSTSASQGT